ncbi:MAG: hypothetical protein E7092_06165 [Bacteroidales bacterium]|nr:hypothetical protein [Bacteroidales bacterium]
MNNDFEDILTSMLEEYENGTDVATIIENSSKEMSVENAELLAASNNMIDAISEKAQLLADARKQRKSRKQWMAEQFDEITDGKTEEEKAAIASAISGVSENIVNEVLTQK